MEGKEYTYSVELKRDLKTNQDIPILCLRDKTTGLEVKRINIRETNINIGIDPTRLTFYSSHRDKVGEILLSDTDELFKFLLSDYSIFYFLKNSLELLIVINKSFSDNLFLKICDKFDDKGILDREKYIPVFVEALKDMISKKDSINDDIIAKIESATPDCQEYIARSVFLKNDLLTFEYEKASLNKKKLYFYLIKCVQTYIQKINKQPDFALTSESFQNLLFAIDKGIPFAFDNLVNPNSCLMLERYKTIQEAIGTYYKNMPKIFEEAKHALTKKGEDIGLLLSGYQELEEQHYNIDYIPYTMDIYKDIYCMNRLKENGLFLKHLIKKIPLIDFTKAATYFNFIILNIEIIQLLGIPEEEVKKGFDELCKKSRYENLEGYTMLHRIYLNETLWLQLKKLKIDEAKIPKIAPLCCDPSFFANSFFDDALFKELEILKAEVKNKQQEELLETLKKLNQKVGNKFTITDIPEEYYIQLECPTPEKKSLLYYLKYDNLVNKLQNYYQIEIFLIQQLVNCFPNYKKVQKESAESYIIKLRGILENIGISAEYDVIQAPDLNDDQITKLKEASSLINTLSLFDKDLLKLQKPQPAAEPPATASKKKGNSKPSPKTKKEDQRKIKKQKEEEKAKKQKKKEKAKEQTKLLKQLASIQQSIEAILENLQKKFSELNNLKDFLERDVSQMAEFPAIKKNEELKQKYETFKQKYEELKQKYEELKKQLNAASPKKEREELLKEFRSLQSEIEETKKELLKTSKSSQSDEIEKPVVEKVAVAVNKVQEEEPEVAAALVSPKKLIKTDDADQKITEQQPINIDTTYSRGIDCYFGQNGVEQDFKKAAEFFESAVNNGNTDAMNALGCCYANGEGVKQDYKKAIELFQGAVDGGNIWAMENLARCYAEGKGVKQNFKKAAEFFESAVNNGNTDAMNALGCCYANGEGVEKNFDKAFELFQQAADGGNIWAMENLARCYAEGLLDVKQDYKKASELFQQAADGGNIWAMDYLGCCYAVGKGVEQDYKEAFKLFQQAADGGNIWAMENLARCYAEGKGVEQDFKKAAEFFESAVNNGNTDAMNALGCCYANGEGVEQDYKKASELFQRAVDGGNIWAMENLARCYAEGLLDVKQDYEKAIELFQQAADGGNIWAMDYLGCCYAVGKGIEQDYEKAIELFQGAVDGGNISCMEKLASCYYNVKDGKYFEKFTELVQLAKKNNDFETINILGCCYAVGKGVKQDYEEAFKLFQQAADNGNVPAMENLIHCYVEGLGVEKNFEEAFKLYQKVREKGAAIDQALVSKIEEAKLKQIEQLQKEIPGPKLLPPTKSKEPTPPLLEMPDDNELLMERNAIKFSSLVKGPPISGAAAVAAAETAIIPRPLDKGNPTPGRKLRIVQNQKQKSKNEEIPPEYHVSSNEGRESWSGRGRSWRGDR